MGIPLPYYASLSAVYFVEAINFVVTSLNVQPHCAVLGRHLGETCRRVSPCQSL